MDDNSDLAALLLEPERVADPYPVYRRMRETGEGVQWSPKFKSWFVSRHADVARAFKESALSSDRVGAYYDQRLGADEQARYERMFSILRRWLVFNDPPDHTRLRRLVNRAFSPRVVEQLRDQVVDVTDGLLTEAAAEGEIDFPKAVGYQLPAIVIAEMLGVPTGEREQFRQWSDDVSALVFGALGEDTRYDRAQRGVLSLEAFFSELAEHYEKHPDDRLISRLLEAEAEGEQLSRDEVISTCILLLFGGHETTANLLSNSLYAMWRQPDERERLGNGTVDARRAVEELIRFDGPTKTGFLQAVDDIEIGGQHIRSGDKVYLVVGSANRDETVFTDPDRVVLDRDAGAHLGFGQGIHYCLGAPLARLEGEIALSRITRGYEYEVDDAGVEWYPLMVSRGTAKLPMKLSPRRT